MKSTFNGMEAAARLSKALESATKPAPEPAYQPTPESAPQAEWDGPEEAQEGPQEPFQDYEVYEDGPAVTLTVSLSLEALQSILGGRR